MGDRGAMENKSLNVSFFILFLCFNTITTRIAYADIAAVLSGVAVPSKMTDYSPCPGDIIYLFRTRIAWLNHRLESMFRISFV